MKKKITILVLIIIILLQGCGMNGDYTKIQDYMADYPYLEDLVRYNWNNNREYFFSNEEVDMNKIYEIEKILNKYPEFHRLAREEGILTSKGGEFHLRKLESKARLVENNLELENVMKEIFKVEDTEEVIKYLSELIEKNPEVSKKIINEFLIDTFVKYNLSRKDIEFLVEDNLELVLMELSNIIIKHDLSQKQCNYLKENPAEALKFKEENIIIGMPDWIVEIVFGKPYDINKTVTAHSTREQWVYKRGEIDRLYLYFEDGELTSWQE